MADSLRWKSKLLSSSVPLEYEASKILIEHGFSTEFDFSYHRIDAGVKKEFSIDIKANGYPPFNLSDIESDLTLLIECKYRQSNKWLFFVDPNEPDMTNHTLGSTINITDEFTDRVLSRDSSIEFDSRQKFCTKGIEIDIEKGSAHESEIKRGIRQLQFSIPSAMYEGISFNINNHPDDNVPFILCAILLTNSDIYIAREEISIESIESAQSIDDIAVRHPFLITTADSSPDFEEQQLFSCRRLIDIAETEKIAKIDEERKSLGIKHISLAREKCHELTRVKGKAFHSQIIVCSLYAFPELLKSIKHCVSETLENSMKQKIHSSGS